MADIEKSDYNCSTLLYQIMSLRSSGQQTKRAKKLSNKFLVRVTVSFMNHCFFVIQFTVAQLFCHLLPSWRVAQMTGDKIV